VESNWRASLSRDALRALSGPTVEISCECDGEISRQRYARRADERQSGHFDGLRIADERLWLGDASQPVDGGWRC
jgi:hypothetical protein